MADGTKRIPLMGDYYLTLDDVCYALTKRIVTKKGGENWKNISYHGSVEKVLKALRAEVERGKLEEAEDLPGILKAVRESNAEVGKVIVEATK